MRVWAYIIEHYGVVALRMSGLRLLLGLLILMLGSPVRGYSADATPEDALTQAVRLTRELAELMRQDVEAVSVDTDIVMQVELNSHLPGQIIRGKGLLVPFFVEAQGGGKLSQEYVALFQVLDPDDNLLEWMQSEGRARKEVALLAFVQLDHRRWKIVDWSTRQVRGSMVTVKACADRYSYVRCRPSDRGFITLSFNGDVFGPNLIVLQASPRVRKASPRDPVSR